VTAGQEKRRQRFGSRSPATVSGEIELRADREPSVSAGVTSGDGPSVDLTRSLHGRATVASPSAPVGVGVVVGVAVA